MAVELRVRRDMDTSRRDRFILGADAFLPHEHGTPSVGHRLPRVRVAFDEQIFAVQAYGGISRMFAELARQFTDEPELGVELLPLNAPIINRYVLDNPRLRAHLAVRDAGHEYRSLLRYFMRVQPRRGQDIVHNTFYLPHGLVQYPKAKRIVTVHDMIPERMPTTRRRLDFLTLKKHYVERADHIICVSEATKLDLLDIYDNVRAPISVVHHGVDPAFQPGRVKPEGLPREYVIFVGNRSSYKDASVLLEAFGRIASDFPDLTMLLVGGGPLTRHEVEQCRSLGIESRVEQRSLRDEDMPGAYGHARLCVFPSRYEGFGLPALEAMACGTPTVLAEATSLPEVGGDAALYFEVGNASHLAEQMRRVLESPAEHERLRQEGLARAAGFTWHRAAVETAAVYASTVAGH